MISSLDALSTLAPLSRTASTMEADAELGDRRVEGEGAPSCRVTDVPAKVPGLPLPPPPMTAVPRVDVGSPNALFPEHRPSGTIRQGAQRRIGDEDGGSTGPWPCLVAAGGAGGRGTPSPPLRRWRSSPGNDVFRAPLIRWGSPLPLVGPSQDRDRACLPHPPGIGPSSDLEPASRTCESRLT